MNAPDRTGHEVVVTLRRIIRAIDLHSRRLTREFGLTGPQLLILTEISRGGGLTVGDVAHRVHLSQATVTVVVDRLEETGLVVRTRDVVDRRRVHLAMTERAAKLLDTRPSLLQERFMERFGRLRSEEQHAILDSLTRVARMMDVEEIPVPPTLTGGLLPGLDAAAETEK
jgi:DNA-binding MarR family transcriptional regulator